LGDNLVEFFGLQDIEDFKNCGSWRLRRMKIGGHYPIGAVEGDEFFRQGRADLAIGADDEYGFGFHLVRNKAPKVEKLCKRKHYPGRLHGEYFGEAL
jgi:hypothetical protein